MKTQNIHIMKTLFILLVLMVFFPVAGAMAEGIVSLNKATVEELTSMEDIDLTPEIAKAIVDYREKNGPFKTPEDLLKVPGMTQDFIEEINPVVVDGDVVHDPDAEPALAPSKC